MRSQAYGLLPEDARFALQTLGGHLQTARRRRRDPLKRVAERLGTSVTTYQKLEAGNPTVSVGLMVAAFVNYGFLDALLTLAHPDTDTIGKSIEHFYLPKRVHKPKRDNDF